MESSYFVYILMFADETLYTGMTTDVVRRLCEHQNGKGGNYTRTHGADTMVYTEVCTSRGEALKREAAIKKLTRTEKIRLIERG